MAYKRGDYDDDWERSESESYESSSSQSDEDISYIPWLEKVGPKGELFYIQQDFSQPLEKNFLTIVPDSDIHRSPRSNATNDTAAKKFKNWMKKRKHKARKPFSLFKAHKFNEDKGNMLFNLMSSKEVYIIANPPRLSLGRKTSVAREILGLELGPVEEFSNSNLIDKIKILKFAPGCEIPDVHPGDWLHSINDTKVYLSDVDNVLLQLDFPAKVKLTILSPCNESSTFKTFYSKHDHISEELLGSYDVVEEMKSHFNYGVFFLKMLDTHESETAQNEVLYKYPDENTSLFLLKGTFITLSHIICDVASPQILSCSVAVKEQTIHVGFFKEGDYILLLAIPAIYASEKDVQYFVKNAARHLKFIHHYLELAFSSEDSKRQVDKFFAMLLKHFLFVQSENVNFSLSYLNAILPSAHWIPLSVKLKTEIDDILNELESSDYDCSSDGFFENQRFYNILGSCLFYKGYLLCSHLMKSDFLDIHLFLNYNHLFLLTKVQAVSEMVIWNEVYLSRFQEEPHHSDGNKGRYFLLAVAMGNCILSVLLESNECTLEPESHPPPEPFYVEEVQNTLIILHNYGIVSAVEKSLHFCVPPIASADMILKGASQALPFPSPNCSTNVSSKSAHCPSNASSLSCDLSSMDRKSDVESNFSDTSNENSPFLGSKTRNFNTSTGSTSGSQASSEYSSPCQFKLNVPSFHEDFSLSPSFDVTSHFTSGNDNYMFHYLHMDPVEGIFLAPPLEEYSFYDGCAMSDILYNFHRCCMKMRSVFSRSLRNEEILNSGVVTKFGINSFLSSAYEQGILFSYSDKDKNKQKSTLSFWIVGRLFFNPEPREVYVCYHDSLQQDIVELAFKLGFGLSL